MPEQSQASAISSDEIIRMAIQSVSQTRFKNESDFMRAVADRAITIQSIAQPNSALVRTLRAKHITGTFDHAEYEQNTHRWLIWFLPDRPLPGKEGQLETIRSDRMDAAYKLVDSAFFDSMRPGMHIMIYKFNDPGDASASSGYRVASFFRILGQAETAPHGSKRS